MKILRRVLEVVNMAQKKSTAEDLNERMRQTREQRDVRRVEVTEIQRRQTLAALEGPLDEMMLKRQAKELDEARAAVARLDAHYDELAQIAGALVADMAMGKYIAAERAVEVRCRDQAAVLADIDQWIEQGARLFERLAETNEAILRTMPRTIEDVPSLMVVSNAAQQASLRITALTGGKWRVGKTAVYSAEAVLASPPMAERSVDECARILDQLRRRRPTPTDLPEPPHAA